MARTNERGRDLESFVLNRGLAVLVEVSVVPLERCVSFRRTRLLARLPRHHPESLMLMSSSRDPRATNGRKPHLRIILTSEGHQSVDLSHLRINERR